MSRLGKSLHLKSTELLVIIVFFLLSLRIINWFQYDRIVLSGDFRPPFSREAFLSRVMYSWTEIDFGMPSVYSPRILEPSYFFTIVFQSLGLSLYLSQMISIFLIYFLTSVLMYKFVKQLTDGDFVAGLVAAIFLTSNVYLIVDREQTAIGFMEVVLMILPCLIAFMEGVKKKSYKTVAFSGLLFILAFSSFPNYRTVLLCFFTLMLTLFFMYVNTGLKVGYQCNGIPRLLKISFNVDLIRTYLKYLSVFFAAFLLSSMWLILLVLTNYEALSVTYRQLAVPPYILYIRPYDIPRLIAKWAFYEGALGKPYVPYANVYEQNPLLIILSYLPPILAFASLLICKSRKLALFFSGVAIASLILVGGFNPYLTGLYNALVTNIPLMLAFRESAQWIFFLVLSYSILIGITFSEILRRLRIRALQVIVIGLVIALFLYTSFPLVTGDVTRNWLNPDLKGSFVPPSYSELNDVLSSEYWTILLPQRDIYVIYNFTEGALGCGNPYPLMFSKPIISGLGTEYLQSERSELIRKLYDLTRTSTYKNVAREGEIRASSTEPAEFEPDKGVDGQLTTRWSSNQSTPQWLEVWWNQTQELSSIRIFFETAYAKDYRIETYNGSGWVTQLTVENNTYTELEHILPEPTNTTGLRLYFTRATVWGNISIWELEIYARTPVVPKFLGMLGIKYLVVEKKMLPFGIGGNLSELRLYENPGFISVENWEEVELLANTYSVERVYVADNILNYTSLDDMGTGIENSGWKTLEHTVLVNSTSTSQTGSATLVAPKNFTWNEVNPTAYEAHLTSNGPFILVFLEDYNERWKAYVDGKPVAEANHFEANAFANGWLVNSIGSLTITIQYEPQILFTSSVVVSAILSASALLFLSFRNLKKVVSLLRKRGGRKDD